ncbi:MAG: KpsF/GutQ family sugar-phosphate isomerase [Chlamydiia bacterium]|nr:KpsF/GutQ family sugar-phosphate isomerase [Chlamydiia bacterium]
MITKSLVATTKELLGEFLDLFDDKKVDELAQKLAEKPGLVFFTGVGKSGLVAQKIAVSMTSTGTRALFLPPVDSLHGDIGLVHPGDFVFLLSKGGESEELLSMIPFLRNRGAHTIAIVCDENSRLAKASDEAIKLPFSKELCPFGMAPTISTTSQLLFGDILTVAVMREKKITADDFTANHPAGKLGKRALMTVKDLMLKGDKIPLAKPDQKLLDVLVELSNKQAGSVLVKDPNHTLLGIFTDGDLRRALQTHGEKVLSQPISALMTITPKSITPDLLLTDALKLMEGYQKQPIQVLPVITPEGKIEGLLKLHDIIQAGI